MNKRKLTILINSIIFITTLYLSTNGILFGVAGNQPGDNVIGLGYFKPFTMDSNIFAGICALLILIFTISQKKVPEWLKKYHLMASSSLFLTFMISALFLAPMNVMQHLSYFAMFKDDLFFFHLLNPILSIISYTCLLDLPEYKKGSAFIGTIPTIIYASVYLYMVVITKKWNDFYNFTFGGRYELVPIVVIVIILLVYLLSYTLVKLKNRIIHIYNG